MRARAGFHRPPENVEMPSSPPPKPGDLKKQRDPLERMADALEKLTVEPEVEIELGPPLCPHCGKLNPMVTVPAQEEQGGPLVELFHMMWCQHCEKGFYVVTESYSCHRDFTEAKAEIEERRAGLS